MCGGTCVYVRDKEKCFLWDHRLFTGTET